MQTHHHRPLSAAPAWTLTLVAAAALSACMGGDEDPPPTPTRLEGVAAVGAPLSNAQVQVIDADAGTTDPAAVTTDATGHYSLDVSGLKAPLLVRVSATLDGEAVQHVAVVPALTAEQANTANVTPFTTAVAALVAPGHDLAALGTLATLAASATADKVGSATQLLVNTLASDSQTAAALGTGFNPLTTSFQANGTGIDAVLDRMNVAIGASGVQITNRDAALGDTGTPAAVTLTAAQTANPGQAPALPATAPPGQLPTAAELTALGAKLQACFALPIGQRVSLDTQGQVTGVLGACRFTVPDWRSNGRTFAEDVGQFVLAKNLVTGARLGAGRITLALQPQQITDAMTVKHPHCNDGPCAVVEWPHTTASGRPGSTLWVLGKVNGRWDFVGNQRPYRAFVETRLVRKINMNRDGAAAGNTVDPYFLKDRVESVIRIVFDPSVGDTSDVRAVRVTGPGLPAAGMVLFRSQRCGSDDFFAIGYQSGSTRTLGNAMQWWTTSGSTNVVMRAANLDGTPLATPQPVNSATQASFQDFSPTIEGPIAAQAPQWSSYKFEVFRYSSNADTPDEAFIVRNGNILEEPAVTTAVPWPTLDAGYATAHLTPAGAQALAHTSLTSSMGWTVPAGAYVSSGYLFGQDFVSAANAQNETATHGYRGRRDYEPAAFGDTTATPWRFASPVAGTAMSPSTASSGSNPNPRCDGPARVPALTTHTSDYREVGLFVRSGDRQVRQAVWFWDN